MYWAPTWGYVYTEEHASCLTVIYCHRAEELFTWEEWPALTRVDAPRTPSKWGTYEQQLRFFDSGPTQPLWCDYYPPLFYDNAYFDLPFGWYEDAVGSDAGEFSFGMPSWRLILDYWYEIQFDCSPERDFNARTWPDSLVYTTKWTGRHSMAGQIGHCHESDNCDSFNVFGDRTNSLVPSTAAKAPDFETFSLSFASDFSFEFWPPGPNVSFSHGSGTRICNSAAWHGSCFWRLSPNSGSSKVRLRIDVASVPGTVHANHFALSDFHAKCPTGPNSGNCQVRLYIRGLDSSGNTTDTYYGSWTTLGEGAGWKTRLIRTKSDKDSGEPGYYEYLFPSNTREWRFVVQGGDGDVIDVDYHNTRVQL